MKTGAVIIDCFRSPVYNPQEGNARETIRSLGIDVIAEIREQPQALLPALHQLGSGYDFLVLAHTGSPLWFSGECRRLINDVTRYRADFGYGDNYPPGAVMEIVRRDALPVMENVRTQKKIFDSRSVLRDVVDVDVNMFDLENLYAPVSLRTCRLNFFADTQQDQHILTRLSALRKPPGEIEPADEYRAFAESVLENRAHLHTIPRYIEIEISRACHRRCTFCPRTLLAPEDDRTMSRDTFTAILDKLRDSIDEPVIALTGLGEPAMHPCLADLADDVISRGGHCIIESSGDGLSRETADRLIALDPRKLDIIFSLEAVDEKLFNSLRPGETGLHSILDTISYVLLRRKQGSWVQALKLNENLHHLVDFNRYFEKYTKNIIIQKYNTWRDQLPERRLNPMQPFERIDCWHLKRELFIDVSGTVRRCRQDLQSTYPLGVLPADSLSDILARQAAFFSEHLAGSAYCSNCDEYYTFNF
jgi:spiro-SPASM protein